MRSQFKKTTLFFIFLSFLFGGCATITGTTKEGEEVLKLNPAKFENMPGWLDDNHHAGLQAFVKSCDRILKKDPEQVFSHNGIGGVYGDWQKPCQKAVELAQSSHKNDPVIARQFFEKWFTPYHAKSGLDSKGLFTGYYEATLYGSKTPNEVYQTPLYKRPDDLVMVELSDFREDLRGRRIAGAVRDNRLKPYATRADIDDGYLKGKGLELVWVSDPADAFFLHIQGSGQVKLSDGRVMRVGYDGQNGHPYHAIGRELIARGELAKDVVSLQSIKEWMKSNPEKAQDLRNMNPSFIFFKEMQSHQPMGSEGVPLTPHRSLAVDRKFIPMSTPMWVNVEHPLHKKHQIQTLMIAQDTGGAIRGPIRGDLFWGSGQDAEVLAGHMKSKGEYWLLLPKQITEFE